MDNKRPSRIDKIVRFLDDTVGVFLFKAALWGLALLAFLGLSFIIYMLAKYPVLALLY